MSQNYRVAAIGRTGRGEYGHGLDKVWLDVPEAKIVAVADNHAGGAAAAAKRLNAQSKLIAFMAAKSSTPEVKSHAQNGK